MLVGPSFKVIVVFLRTCWSVNRVCGAKKKNAKRTHLPLRKRTLRVFELLPSSFCKIPVICNNPFKCNNISKCVVYNFLFYSTSSSNILCTVSCLHSQSTLIIFLYPLSICVSSRMSSIFGMRAI